MSQKLIGEICITRRLERLIMHPLKSGETSLKPAKATFGLLAVSFLNS